jgi:MFS family permease
MAILGPAVQNTAQPQRQFAAFSLSNRLAAAMAERNLYYGWVVAGSTFLVMLATAGAMGAPGVIIQPLEKEFGWSTAQISVALAVRLALFGLIAPFAAAFINRFGVRPVVVSAVAMIVAGILASMAMTQVWELVALWGVIVGIGTGMVALVRSATRPGGRYADGEQRNRTAHLSAAHRQADTGLRLAECARFRRRHAARRFIRRADGAA